MRRPRRVYVDLVNTSNWRELRTIPLAVKDAVYRARMSGKKEGKLKFIMVTSDNEANVHIINKLPTRSPDLRVLVDLIRKDLDREGVQLAARHIPGVENILTDEDSRVAVHKPSQELGISSPIRSYTSAIEAQRDPPPRQRSHAWRVAIPSCVAHPFSRLPPPATRMEGGSA